MTLRALTLLAFLIPAGALAQTIPAPAECTDWRASVQAIAEPWEDNTRTFAAGEIRLTVIDTGEPAAGSFFLLIMSPPYGEDGGGRQCKLLALDDSMGFASLSLAKSAATEDAAKGLTVTIPATRWLPDTDTYADAVLSVTVNPASGAIVAQLD